MPICLANPVADHPLNRGLVSWWLPLTNNSGGRTLFDLQKTGRNHGTLTNGPSWGVGPNESRAVNYAGVAFGAQHRVTVASNIDLAADFTLTAAVLTTATRRSSMMERAGGGNTDWTWGFYTNASNRLGMYLYDTVSPGAVEAAGDALATNTVYHVAVARIGSTVTLYLNGRSVGSGSNSTAASGSSSSTTFGGYISSGDMTSPWNGWMTDHRVYLGRGLSSSDVGRLYEQSLRGYPDLLRRVPRRWVFVAGGGTTDGVGSAAGTSSVSGVGASTAAAVGSSSGVGTASGVGDGAVASVGTAGGVATASGDGTGAAVATGSTAGTSTAAGVGTSVTSAAGSAAGVATASAVGVSAATAAGASSGSGTAAAVGSVLAQAVGACVALALATGAGVSTAAAAGTAAGTSTATGYSPGAASDDVMLVFIF